uniref:Putative site-specific tyrosine recombinase n=2 Tax=viral metagenome TaxID=1070528 RepID=A0A6M3IZ28_9ZZZZ
MGTPLNYTYRVDKKELRDSALKRMDRWFTEDEVLKILNHPMRLRTALMLRLLVETGIRVQELSNIVGNDIDIQERTLRVKVSKTKPRVVFFSPKTVDLLIEHDETVKFIKIFPKKRLFPGIPQIQLAVNTTLVELGLKEKQDGRGPHTFRHYFATFLFYVGDMWIGDIARLMGDTPDVVEKTYLHPTSTMLRKRVDKAMDW